MKKNSVINKRKLLENTFVSSLIKFLLNNGRIKNNKTTQYQILERFTYW